MKKSYEEILEAIWKEDEAGSACIKDIRKKCATEITDEDLEGLEELALIKHEGDRIELTYEGRQEARGVVRRHRLAEILFTTVLDLDPETRETIACEVEHTLLPEVEEAICTLLGHPEVCPDGKAIPPGRCCTAKRSTTSTVVTNLVNLKPGERGRITYIKPKEHDRLHKLTSFGLTPGIVLEVHQISPAFCVRFEGTELALNHDVAEDIYVARTNNGG